MSNHLSKPNLIKSYNDIELLTSSLYKQIDQSVNEYIDEAPYNLANNLACTEKCSLCCKTLRVELLPTEAIYIAKKLLLALNKQEISILKKKLYENREYLKYKTLSEIKTQQNICPFLIDEKCSIYKHRPYVCRKLISFDYNMCLLGSSSQEHMDGLLKKIKDKNFFTNYYKSLEKSDLDRTPIELSDGIFTILNDPSIIDKYLNKQRQLFYQLAELKRL